MDIYKWAEEYGYAADYEDPGTGWIYACTEAKYHDGKIPVYELDENLKKQFIGYASQKLYEELKDYPR